VPPPWRAVESARGLSPVGMVADPVSWSKSRVISVVLEIVD
jgi:hypothetical protein